jgi:ABC-type dipeptide/oligopeptide/nickel transport system permease subunit
MAVGTAETSSGTSTDATAVQGRSLKAIVWGRLKRDRTAVISMVGLSVILLTAIFAPLITRLIGVDPYSFNPDQLSSAGSLPLGNFGGISLQHPLGVEPQTGRDILARLLYGARLSLFITLTATVITIVVGTLAGIVAGYRGGWIDTVISRLSDLTLVFPVLVLLIALGPVAQQIAADAGLDPNTGRVSFIIFVLGLFGWPYLGRLVRGQVLSLREREFVEAAESLGAPGRRVLFAEILPNLIAPIIVVMSILLPSFIITEATLSFLGVGVLPPTPTWGNMLEDSVKFFTVVPTYMFIPGTALLITVLLFNLLGDSIRDAVDPRAGRV